MAVICVERTKDYTIMANQYMSNKELTMKVKVPMPVLLFLPGEWYYSISGLIPIVWKAQMLFRVPSVNWRSTVLG